MDQSPPGNPNPQERWKEGRELLHDNGLATDEELIKALQEAKAETVKLKQMLEIARLRAAQQELINLDMRMKVDLMHLGNIQLVSCFNFQMRVRLHQVKQAIKMEEAHATEGKSTEHKGD